MMARLNLPRSGLLEQWATADPEYAGAFSGRATGMVDN
jgi:hypothetical protein